MDSQSNSHRVQTAKYPALVYFILIAVVSETLFIHFNATSQSDKLRLRIDDLEKELSINKGELAELRSVGSNGKQFYMKHVKDLHRNIQSRVRRGIQKNSHSILRALDEVRMQVLQLIEQDSGPKFGCKNVSLVCKKGERGRRGSVGPRGFKGDSGGKGDRGVAGQRGQTGPPGAIGQKGQKGDCGQPETSLEKPRILTQFPPSVTKIESDNLTLFCEASGFPPPNIRWDFSSEIVTSQYTFPEKGELFIASISKGDEGRIRCIAENILGRDVIRTRLIVRPLPKVILTSNALAATEGMPFQVVCRTDSKPTPVLKWKGRNLTARQELSLDRTSLTLIMERPVLSDSGLYICEAKNNVGRSEKSLFLQVSLPRDCSSFKGSKISGIYTISPDGRQPFRVFCDMLTYGGGWTVIQRRTDGSVDFFRNWNDYKIGFGNLEKEFWLGNENIHRLTKHTKMEIRFDFYGRSGTKVDATYYSFYIDGEDANYRVRVGRYDGRAGDSFSDTNGMQFSTKDRDNDISSSNCAVDSHGAWWYNSCYDSNLNGKYGQGIHWRTISGYRSSLSWAEMKVRPS